MDRAQDDNNSHYLAILRSHFAAYAELTPRNKGNNDRVTEPRALLYDNVIQSISIISNYRNLAQFQVPRWLLATTASLSISTYLASGPLQVEQAVSASLNFFKIHLF